MRKHMYDSSGHSEFVNGTLSPNVVRTPRRHSIALTELPKYNKAKSTTKCPKLSMLMNIT